MLRWRKRSSRSAKRETREVRTRSIPVPSLLPKRNTGKGRYPTSTPNQSLVHPPHTCFLCNRPGHIARPCTVGVPIRNSPPHRDRLVLGNCAVMINESFLTDVTLQCGCKFPVVASACVQHESDCNLPVVNGYVERFPVMESSCNAVLFNMSN